MEQAQALIDKLEASQNKQIQVLVVPNIACEATDQIDFLDGFATDSFFQLGMDRKNGGIVLVIDQGRMRANQAGKIYLKPDDVWKARFTNDVSASILNNYAKPLILEGDYDGAVRAALQGIDDYLSRTGSTAPLGSSGGGGSPISQAPPPAGSVEAEGIKKETLIWVALAIGLAAGGFFGGREVLNRRRDAAVVNTALESLGVSKENLTNFRDVYRLQTLQALLTHSEGLPELNGVQTDKMTEALDIVVPRVNKRESQKLMNVALYQALDHSAIQLREYFADFAWKNHKPEQASEVANRFLARIPMESEQSFDFIQTLAGGAAKLLTPMEAQRLSSELGHQHWGMRMAAATALSRKDVFQPKTHLEQFFNRIEVEFEPNVIQALQAGVAANAQDNPFYTDFLLDKLSTGKTQARSAAVQGLGKLGQEKYFTPLYEQFGRETNDNLDPIFTQALTACIRESHLDIAHQDLEKPDARYQKLALALLLKLDRAQSVDKLFTYIENPDSVSLFPDVARQVAVEAAESVNHDFALGKLKSPDAVARRTAAEIVGKLALPTDLPALLEAYEVEKDGSDLDPFYDAILSCGQNDAGMGILEQGFTDWTSDRARVAVLDAMTQHGVASLVPMMKFADQSLQFNLSIPVLQQINENVIHLTTNRTDGYALIKPYLKSQDPSAIKIASNGVTQIVRYWHNNASYDDSDVMQELAALGQGRTGLPHVSAAKQARQSLVSEKASEIRGWGNSLSVGHSYSSSASTIRRYSSAPESEIRSAVTTALSQLQSRQSAWQAEQERLKREAAERARQSSSSGGPGASRGTGAGL